MSTRTSNKETSQVDFYLLGSAELQAGFLACRLALMAWERKQQVFVITTSQDASKALDQQMWEFPENRFLPHTLHDDPDAAKTAINIGAISGLKPTDVVINLCAEAVPQPERFKRVLEIVPFQESERQASRIKFKHYRKLGLAPQMHEINK